MSRLKKPLSKNRIDLRKEIPLEQPTKICIDPSDVCNFHCDFCGLHSFRNETYSGCVMSKKNFETVVNQLTEFAHPIKQIHLYALGEPFINPNIVEFVRLIKEKKVAEEVIIVSNGSLLSKKLSEDLVDAGLDELRISLNGLSDDDYYRIVGKKISFEKLYDEICYYHKIGGKVHVKILGDYFSDEEKNKFIALFEGRCDSIDITNVIKNLDTQEFNVGVSGQNQHGLKFHDSDCKVCPQMFYELVVHANGEVGPCSADYCFYTDSLGNIQETTLKNIWNGERLNNMRIASLRGESIKYGNCNSCNFIRDGVTVDLTPFREEILNRMLQKE